MFALQTWQFENNRAFGYEAGEIGSAIASGLGFSWPENSVNNAGKPPELTSWEAPIYPFIIGGIFKVFGIYSSISAVVLMVLQAMTSAINCVLLFLIGRRVFNESVGILAAFMLTFYPLDIYFCVMKVGSISLYVCMILLFILQLYDLADAPNIKKGIFAGFTFGLALLIFPAVISFLPFALAWLFFRGQAKRKMLMFNAALVFFVVCLTISPWQIRNYSVFGRFIFIKSNFSRALYLGNYGSWKDIIKEKQQRASLDEGGISKLYEKKILGSILSNPLRLVTQSFDRFVSFWTITPRSGGPKANISGMKDKVAGIFYLFVLVFGATGLFLTHLKIREVQLLILAVLTLPIPFYLTWFTHFRYRYPTEIILMLFASFTLYRIYGLLKKEM